MGKFGKTVGLKHRGAARQTGIHDTARKKSRWSMRKYSVAKD